MLYSITKMNTLYKITKEWKENAKIDASQYEDLYKESVDSNENFFLLTPLEQEAIRIIKNIKKRYKLNFFILRI